MHELIEKLLILQDRDRKIMRARVERDNIGPERKMLEAKLADGQGRLEGARLRGRQIESERKELELEVEAKKQQIGKYSLQQFQTKKNEEYRALAHEIDGCKEAIVKIEDRELELMEQADQVAKEIASVAQETQEARKKVEAHLSNLAEREGALTKLLTELESGRDELTSGVPDDLLPRYERLRKTKGDKVVVGVEHSVCGGCHMKLPVQIIVSCQGHQDIISCPNCGRILYYTREMDLAVAD